MDAGLLQVHVFTVNVVAPYTDIYTKKWRQISSASLLERHVHVPKQSYIDFGDNFNFGKLVCRRVWLLASWSVYELVVSELDCRRVGLSASCPVTFLSCWTVSLHWTDFIFTNWLNQAWTFNVSMQRSLLYCTLSLAAQYIVIGLVCNWRVGGHCFLCLWLCGSVTMITRNCVHRSSPNWIYRWR